MAFTRPNVFDGGLQRPARSGDGLLSALLLNVVTADAAATLDVNMIAGGAVRFSGLTAGRNFTTDTAANIIAANPGMDIGDSIAMIVSISTAFAGTLVAGAGVTLAGKATVVASGLAIIVFTKTSATTVTCTVL